MNEHELKQALGRQIESATGASGDEISQQRANLYERYMGELYGDEVENRSSVVSTDVADTVEWIMPELMQIFTGGDRIGVFDPVGPEDEQAAEQETDVVNHVLMDKNDGFMVLYEFLKDGLIAKNGYAKRIWTERERVTTEEYEGLSPAQWMKMQADWQSRGWAVEILREDISYEEMPEDGADQINVLYQMPEPSISVEVELSRTEEKLVVESVPPEELLVSPRWHKISLDECPFIAHRRVVTVSDLVEMGYDRKQVEDLPDAEDDEWSEERIERFNARNQSEYEQREEMDRSMREVTIFECYCFLDWNGDGKAERRKITAAGTGYELLKWADTGEIDNDEVETQPFSAWTPVPIPHRHYGRSIAELVSDIQRVKTVLWRQMLDNMYLSNNPTREIAEDGLGEHTLSDILFDRPGKVVRTALPGMYAEHSPPQFMAQTLPAMEYVDTVRENRTGVTRYNQGLDANSLNKTATGIQKVMSASMKKLALYARLFAETGLKHLLLGIHGDLRRNATKRLSMRLKGEHIEVDPRSWAERADMTVTVGAGTIDKELRAMVLEKIIMEQKEHLMVRSPLVQPQNLFNAYERFVENAGLRNVDEFFVNPRGQELPPQPEAQGDGQAEAYVQAAQIKAQVQAQGDQQKLMGDMMKARMEDDRKRDESMMKLFTTLAEINAKLGAQQSIEQMKAQAGLVGQAFNTPGNGGA